MASPRVLDHPLVQRDLALLRAKDTKRVTFRAAMRRIARALAHEGLRAVRTREIRVETPLETTAGVALAESIAIVPILRAGLGLVDGFLDVLPEARVCHLGMVRDEQSLEPTVYLTRIEGLADVDRVFLLDPMVATGGSIIAGLDILRRNGIEGCSILSVLLAPEALERIGREHPHTSILTTAMDRELDENAFIRPGLGDAGDRLFDI